MTSDLEAENVRLRELLRQAEGQLDYHGDRSDLGARIAQAIAAISPPSASEQRAPVAGSPDAWRG